MIPSNNLLTPLHSAARRGFLDICDLLLKDSRVEAAVGLGSGWVQPFHLACMSGNRELCELFLRNGADITSNSRSKYTPLHVASYQGDEDVCHLLIETGNYVLFLNGHLAHFLLHICTFHFDVAPFYSQFFKDTVFHRPFTQDHSPLVDILFLFWCFKFIFKALYTISSHNSFQKAA